MNTRFLLKRHCEQANNNIDNAEKHLIAIYDKMKDERYNKYKRLIEAIIRGLEQEKEFILKLREAI